MALPAQVAQALRDPRAGRINFRCGATAVYGNGYHVIANAIESGRIRIERLDAGASASATYSFTQSSSATADTLYLRADFDFARHLSVALLVHEATHALQDYHRREMGVIESECAAHIAQAFCFLVRGTSWEDEAARGRAALRMPARNPLMDRIIAASHAAASRIFTTEGGYTVTEPERAALRRALLRHPLYTRRRAHVAAFNGL